MTEKLKKQWYVIPPYANEGWQISNQEGEHVATFELEEECKEAVKNHNEKLPFRVIDL